MSFTSQSRISIDLELVTADDDRFAVDSAFISANEGGQVLTGYVPASPDGTPLANSGVTIATGDDLGDKTEAGLKDIGIATPLVTKLKPYLGLKGQDAQNKLDEAGGLDITQSEADALDKAIHSATFESIANDFDATSLMEFRALPSEAQTAIQDLAIQYGPNMPTRTPNFWMKVTGGSWAMAIDELRDFGDDFPMRRGSEADLLQHAIDTGTLAAR